MIARLANLCLLLSLALISVAQQPAKPTAVDIHRQLEKFNFLGTALYVAAHPDDENTRMISYLSNELNARTAYLSLTRGDGGQNRVGKEIGAALGYIRTHELLGARSIDGGQQFFTRAVDFGYSKHPKETLAIWNEDEIKHDMVKVYREFRPDVIINRFDHRTPGRTHGHHTSSAMLGLEVIDLAADPTFMSDRLGHLEPWQVHRATHNTSWWFYGSREKFAKADKSNLISMDIGAYYADRGQSNTEIAAASRSMHKSQGFGSTGTRGSQMEYLEVLRGDVPADNTSLFEGVNTTWSRVAGGAEIGTAVDAILSNYNYGNPAAHLNELIAIYKKVESIEDTYWKNIKLKELENIILASAGIYLEAVSDEQIATTGETVEVQLEMINRSTADVVVTKAEMDGVEFIDSALILKANEANRKQAYYTLPKGMATSNPYWLNEKGSYGMYHVSDEAHISSPLNRDGLSADIGLTINGLSLSVSRPVVYKRTDPVIGEVYKPFAVLPKASVEMSDPVYIFADRNQKDVVVTVKAYADSLRGVLKLNHSNSWIVTPESQYITLDNKGEEMQFTFKVKPPFLSESSSLSAELSLDDGNLVNKRIQEIDYTHIPTLHMLKDATAKVERIDLKKQGNKIAYIPGAGDLVAESLRQVGYNVDEIPASEITADRLAGYDATILGVRAYNTKKDLLLKKKALNEYMTNGGTVIVQYTTPRGGIRGNDIAPYPMTLSRTRVTDETATMSYVDADHEVLNYPNKLNVRDFEKWVQERGLYYASEWDERYTTPIAAADPDEPLAKGGLLIAPVGEGYFIYSGISWFRQLPAGVPGAYRFFTNLISIGKNDIPTESTTDGK